MADCTVSVVCGFASGACKAAGIFAEPGRREVVVRVGKRRHPCDEFVAVVGTLADALAVDPYFGAPFPMAAAGLFPARRRVEVNR